MDDNNIISEEIQETAGEAVCPGPYSAVFEKINFLRSNTVDSSFHEYLDVRADEASRGLKTPDDLMTDLDANYQRYLQIMANANPNANVNVNANSAVNVNSAYVANYSKQKVKRNEVEIKVGAGILSVIGALFLLVALVYFGTYFLNDIFQGVLIFAAGAVVILVSEIVLEKRLPKFAHVVTGLGFSALYFSAVFSCMYLHMFDFTVALLVILCIALVNVLFARIRKSPVMEIVCSAGSVAYIYAIGDVSHDQFVLLGALMLIVNLVLFIAPYKKEYTASKIIRLVFVFISCGYLLDLTYKLDFLYYEGFIILTIFVMMIAYCFNTQNMGIKATDLSLIGILAFEVTRFEKTLELNSDLLIEVCALFAICLLCFFIMIKKKEKWSAYSLFILTVLVLTTNLKDDNLTVLVALVTLLISKLLIGVKELTPIDAIITVMSLLIACRTDNPLSYAIAGVAIIGAIMCTRIKLFHEYILLVFSVPFVFNGIKALKGDFSYLFLPVWLLVVLILVLMFNLIPTMQVKGSKAYNITTVAFLASGILLAPVFGYKGTEQIVVLCSCVLIATIACLVLFRKKFMMNTGARYIILAVTLTYLALFMDIGNLWISISLMAVAFVLIAIGCIANRFELRIYGLVLSLLVCAKVAFYDFKNESEFNRMIVFFVVGLLAIGISFVYLILEKMQQKELKAMKEKEIVPCVQLTEQQQQQQ